MALPTCVLVLGMAGSGKTTLVQRLAAHLHAAGTPPYVVNLDPACNRVPYPVNVDIRDTVKYREVMKQYGLGPNGSIVTSLNLFATRFDQVLKLIGRRSSELRYVILDTPGQIEVFTWSASGSIVTESLASEFPTVVVYVLDVARSVNPVTFVSSMLYACSILYKTKLPFVLAMNKVDVVGHGFALEWMRDFEAFQDALRNEGSHVSNLSSSLGLALEEFYGRLNVVGMSAVTGTGVGEFFAAIDEARGEYERDYRPEYDRLRREKEETVVAGREEQLRRLKEDEREDAPRFGEPPDSNAERHDERSLFLPPRAATELSHVSLEPGCSDPSSEEECGDVRDPAEKGECESFEAFLRREGAKRRTKGAPRQRCAKE